MLTRLEHFAVEAMQAMIVHLRGSSISDEQLARRAFEIASAMDAEASKHNLAERAEKAAMAEADEYVEQLRAQHAERSGRIGTVEFPASAVTFGGAEQ